MFKVVKEDTKTGAISNKVFYEIEKRVLEIMKKLEIVNSFTMKGYAEITTQAEIINKAIDIIDNEINEHLSNYIE